MHNYFEYLEKVRLKFNSNIEEISPKFEFKAVEGLFRHKELDQTVLPIKSNDKLTNEFNREERPVLGTYIKSTNNECHFEIYDDAIAKISKEYSEEKSKLNALGFITKDGKGHTGVDFNTARNLVETIVKLQLCVFYLLHKEIGVWQSEYFSSSNKNIHYINSVADEITKSVLDGEILKCYYFLNTIDTKNKLRFNLDNPVLFAKTAVFFKEEDWGIVNKLEDFINSFPDSILQDFQFAYEDKSFDTYLKENKFRFQDEIIIKAKDKGWQIIQSYLSEENNYKYRGSITAEKFGS